MAFAEYHSAQSQRLIIPTMERYDPATVEARWQQRWQDEGIESD